MKRIEPLDEVSKESREYFIKVKPDELKMWDKLNELVHAVNSLLPEEPKQPCHQPTNDPMINVYGKIKCEKCGNWYEPKERLADVLEERWCSDSVSYEWEKNFQRQANAAIEFFLKKICDAGLYCPQLETLLNQMRSQ